VVDPVARQPDAPQAVDARAIRRDPARAHCAEVGHGAVVGRVARRCSSLG